MSLFFHSSTSTNDHYKALNFPTACPMSINENNYSTLITLYKQNVLGKNRKKEQKNEICTCAIMFHEIKQNKKKKKESKLIAIITFTMVHTELSKLPHQMRLPAGRSCNSK